MKYINLLIIITIIQSACNSQIQPSYESYTKKFQDINAPSLSFLDEELDDVRIVGYGEDTHGTAEFTLLAKELMHYLSETHGYSVIIIETGVGEGAYLNDYIHGRRDDLTDILDNHNSTWRYRTDEFHQLMNWLRDYNTSATDKIHLHGCEMQYVISDVHRIESYLSEVGENYKIEGFEKHIWQDISEAEKSAYQASYTQLKELLDMNRESYIHKTSQAAYNMATQHAEVLSQFLITINQTEEQQVHDLRDLNMSRNISWTLQHHGNNSKALYWAHNAHVGDWISNGSVPVAGLQLRKLYGDAYYNIATDFGNGSYLAFSHDANQTNNWKLMPHQHDTILPHTLTYQLRQMKGPHVYLNLRAARKDTKLRDTLSQNIVTMSGAGARARRSNTETNDIGRAFDGIIYLDHTSPITLLD